MRAVLSATYPKIRRSPVISPVSFKSMDVDSLTQKLSELLNAPDENLYAKEQRAYIMKNYNYENVVKKTEQIYRKALNK